MEGQGRSWIAFIHHWIDISGEWVVGGGLYTTCSERLLWHPSASVSCDYSQCLLFLKDSNPLIGWEPCAAICATNQPAQKIRVIKISLEGHQSNRSMHVVCRIIVSVVAVLVLVIQPQLLGSPSKFQTNIAKCLIDLVCSNPIDVWFFIIFKYLSFSSHCSPLTFL